ncbi:DUF1269 domain-containing protein [Noviherbaspirillum cavernae]|nr:DUF1269 domain-containing protein [Noviherbaspirillum cavernae]
MDKMLVVAFDDEKKAYEGIKALKELHAEGSLSLYSAAVIAKDKQGVIAIKQASDQGVTGTVFGLATGSLIGLLGGPVGIAAGAVTGTMAGSLYDLAQAGVDADFLNEVSQHLSPGKTAIVAEVEEDWITPLDTRMDALGGMVFRQARGAFVDAQIEHGIAADKAEITRLKAEHTQSVGEAKTRIEKKIHAAQDRMKARRDRLNEKIAAIKREGEAKVKLIEEQETKVQDEAKARLEERLAEMRIDYDSRVDKLSKAWKLVKEAAAI